MPDPFEKRIRRAETLQKEWPFAQELLAFFQRVSQLQRIQDVLPGFGEPGGQSPRLSVVARVLEKHGPPAIALKAAEVKSWTSLQQERFLTDFWQAAGIPGPDPILDALARISLQPWAMMIDRRYRPHAQTEGRPQMRCACCGQPPVVSLLREDTSAETVRRSLICSLCCLEWGYPRVLCPNCGEERPEKLPRYTAQEIAWVRVEACDTCGRYLKAVDLTLNWDADPVVDELASTPLDIVARDHGYTKIAPNLAGV